MASPTKFQQVKDYIQKARDSTGQKDAAVKQNLMGAFADPEAYGKITDISDQGVAGINLAVRKHHDAVEDFNNLFIERAKQYSKYKDRIKREGTTIRDAFAKAESMAKKYGLSCMI